MACRLLAGAATLASVSPKPTSFLAALLPILVLVCLVCACKKETPTPESVPSAAPPVLAASAPLPAPSATVAASGKMAHCPSAVERTTTRIRDVDGGVEVTVTAGADDAVPELRARAKFLADAASTPSTTVKHNGQGEGGGIFGRCPIVMRDTSVAVADVDKGSRITVTPKDPAQVDWLRRETRQRSSELGAPGSAGAGVNKMAHCPSAVEGATTQIKDGKGAFDVIVTAKTGDAVSEIRSRARHLVDAAKNDAATLAHTGDGTGGGGQGRCPVVMEDTAVTQKDIDGGVDLTVKPAKATDLASIRQEAQDRAAKFAPTTK